MKCKACGCEFDEGVYCPECGTKFSKENELWSESKDNVIQDLNYDNLSKNKDILNETNSYEKELELEKINLERAKIEKERLEIEEKNNELLMRIQKAKEEESIKQAEIATRTFKGKIYNSIEEMEIVKEENAKIKAQKKVDALAIWCFVLSLLPFTIIGAYFFWATSIASVVLGIFALKGKTNKKGFAIAGFIITGLFLLLIIVFIFIAILDYL